jgi:2-polyprenyl-6-methoxyphenol hydroxylase-like FAD-dependent oxidoreductase
MASIPPMPVDTPVLVVGAGPAGLVLAIELGHKGVPCIVVEQNEGTSTFPKANLTSARSMEHYRRLGFAREFRATGLPDDFPQDVTFWTRYATHELARLKVPSAREALEMNPERRGNWMTPELAHRAQQMAFEVLLRQAAEKLPCVELRYGWRLIDFQDLGNRVEATLEHLASGRLERPSSAFLVGCDGPRSCVRERLGIHYEGEGSADRDFFGGKMLAMHFQSPAMYDVIKGPRAWHYWTVNRERRALMVSLDGRARFVAHMQLPRGTRASQTLAWQWLHQAAGAEVPLAILGVLEWTAGYTLVAERYGAGRVLLAGDATHLFTPAAGLGYNTAIDDVANLAWKLAAVLQGWGGPALLATYEQERRAIGIRNTRFARSTADSIGNIPVPDELEAKTPAGEQARRELGRRLHGIMVKEFEIPGLVLGLCYRDSPIVSQENRPPPNDDMHLYRPSTYPGCRAPHFYLRDGRSILDCTGHGLTLLCLGGDARGAAAMAKAAAAAGVPFSVQGIDETEARELYGYDYVLVRPDQHVAWRGNAPPSEPERLLARVTGRL